MYYSLIAVIFLIYFPVLIQVQGYDAITTGTLSIYLLLVFYLLKRPSFFRGAYFSRAVFFLIVVGMISTLSIQSDFLAPSFRRFVASSAGLLLFYLVININAGLPHQEQKQRTEFFISFVLIMYAIQVIIGIAIYFIPQLGDYFSIFTTREVETIETSVTDGVKRMTSIMIGQETLGEIVAVLAPLALYKILAQNKKFYYLVLAILFVGVTLSATRSGFLLFFFALLLFMLTVLPMVKLPTWSLFLAVVAIGGPLVVLQFPGVFAPIIERLGNFVDVYSKSNSLAVAVNRDGVWHYISLVLLPNISLFGNGFLSIYHNQSFDFHNLYATVLHRFGIVGFVLFFYILYKVGVSLYRVKKVPRGRADKALLSACLISMLVLLINEFKFDFIRQASYQQTIWLLLGVYYLVYLRVQIEYFETRRPTENVGKTKKPAGLLTRHPSRQEARPL